MKFFYWFGIFVLVLVMFWKSKKETTEESDTPNFDFYMNKKKSVPYGDYIDNIHKNWFKDYDKLEKHHG